MRKSIIKNVFCIILMTIIICMISTTSNAATLDMSKSKSEVTIGETFTVTISAGNGAGRIDVSATNATLSSTGDFLDNSSITITVTPTATGTVTVTASGSLADYTTEQEENFSKSVSVNVKEKVTPPVTSQEPETPNTTTTPQEQETKSSNANLKSMTISQEGLTPTFNKSTTDYVLTVGNDVESIQIDATPEDSKAKVTVSGNTDLVEGENTVKIVVKAEDGSTKTYNITVIKAARMDMLLDKLEILGISEEKDDIPVSLTPEFNPEIFYYTIDIAEDINSLSINATSIVDDAIIEITGNENLVEGENTITITLKMPEGEDKIEYKIIANKATIGLDNELENNEENQENKSWLTPQLNRILTTICISIITIAGIVFGVIEYRYTKQNPKEKKEKKKDKNRFENEELNNINEETNNEPKKTEKSGKHF